MLNLSAALALGRWRVFKNKERLFLKLNVPFKRQAFFEVNETQYACLAAAAYVYVRDFDLGASVQIGPYQVGLGVARRWDELLAGAEAQGPQAEPDAVNVTSADAQEDPALSKL